MGYNNVLEMFKTFDYSTPTSKGFQIGEVYLYFSYKTLIAFEDNTGLTIRENDWSNTTGKHLNAINENKELRVSSALFEEKFKEFCLKHFNFINQEIADTLKNGI